MTINGTLGIIAGGGTLPQQLVNHCKTTEQPYHIIALKQFAESDLANDPHATSLPITSASTIIQTLKNQKVTHVVFTGRVTRPRLRFNIFDFKACKLLWRFFTKRNRGDNALLTTVIGFLESEGFKVIAIDNLLQKIVADAGAISEHEPNTQELADIALGAQAAHTIGQLDIGQSVIVQNGQIIGVEGLEGTDRLISRCAEFMEPGKAILVKMKKPGQDERVDLPTIGLNTIKMANTHKLAGIAVEAGGTLIADFEQTISLANESHLFIYGATVEESAENDG